MVLSEKESPIVTVYFYYNRKRIKLMDNLVVYVSSLGWTVKSEKFLISENRTPFLLGLDLQSQLGVRTTQIRPPRPLVGKVFQSDINETSDFWRSHFHKKYQHVLSRIGRAKSQEGHIVQLNKYTSEHFISLIVIRSQKDGSVKWQ